MEKAEHASRIISTCNASSRYALFYVNIHWVLLIYVQCTWKCRVGLQWIYVCLARIYMRCRCLNGSCRNQPIYNHFTGLLVNIHMCFAFLQFLLNIQASIYTAETSIPSYGHSPDRLVDNVYWIYIDVYWAQYTYVYWSYIDVYQCILSSIYTCILMYIRHFWTISPSRFTVPIYINIHAHLRVYWHGSRQHSIYMRISNIHQYTRRFSIYIPHRRTRLGHVYRDVNIHQTRQYT